MPFNPRSPEVTATVRGAYAVDSDLQFLGAAAGLEMLSAAMEIVPLDHRPLCIANYGSAGGKSSLVTISQALRTLRARAKNDQPISVIHVDRPENDFSHLFRLLHDHPDSRFMCDPQVYPLAVGRSIYGQVLPEATVILGWSVLSVQWLSRMPTDNAGHVWSAMAGAESQAIFQAQSDDDWQSFLDHRAVELAPGGCLVVVQPISGKDQPTFRSLMTWFQQEISDMRTDGMLDADEAARMTVHMRERTPEQMRAPFTGGSYKGLRILAERISELPDPYWPAYQAGRDFQALSARYTNLFQCMFVPSLMLALNYSRSDAFARAFRGRLLTGIRQRLQAEPQSLLTPLATHALLLRKD
ncbi:hypothetical protein ACLBXM_15850 [Xanthobacteraceae bacterium A53D]